MKHIVKLRYDEPLIRKAVSAFWWKSIGKKAVIGIPLSTVCAIYIVSRGNWFWTVIVLMSVLAIVSLLLVALYIAHKKHAVDKLHTMVEPTAEIRVDADSFSITSELEARELNWSVLPDLWKFDDFWLLFFAKADFVTLPLVSIPIEMRNFISEQIQRSESKDAS